ncbi:Cytochrome c oxidase subunit Vc family protein [Trifolium repens]|nr:Cytochrome c oxidase subunit Vc family protein [Trifolium repens]
MAGPRIAHATLKGPSVVKEIVIGIVLGLAAGSVWKMHHWNEQRKTRTFYDLLEKDELIPSNKFLVLCCELYIVGLWKFHNAFFFCFSCWRYVLGDMGGDDNITVLVNHEAAAQCAIIAIEAIE